MASLMMALEIEGFETEEWISVTEDKPEPGWPLLLYSKEFGVKFGSWTGDKWEINEARIPCGTTSDDYTVTHWMLWLSPTEKV